MLLGYILPAGGIWFRVIRHEDLSKIDSGNCGSSSIMRITCSSSSMPTPTPSPALALKAASVAAPGGLHHLSHPADEPGPRTRTMVELWRFPHAPSSKSTNPFEPLGRVISRPSHALLLTIDYDVIIDHHPSAPRARARFVDPPGTRLQLHHPDGIMLRRAKIKLLPQIGHGLVLRHQNRHPQLRAALHRSRYPGLSLPLRLYPPCPGAQHRSGRTNPGNAGLFQHGLRAGSGARNGSLPRRPGAQP